jgi:8-oxo-dGTP pyrophosphatase MutT (NUDIX family)
VPGGLSLPQKGDRLKLALRALLAGPLPGAAAHADALPRGFEREVVPKRAPLTHASVLLSLQPNAKDGRIVIPLILRPNGVEPHAGQVGLPGGAREAGEDAVGCALREAHEEIGLDPHRVDPLGRLTPITIPVSRYLVETVVGWVDEPSRYVLEEREVLRILYADPERLAQSGPTAVVERVVGGKSVRFPAYGVEDEKVWGATALILSEFLHIWRKTAPPH